MEMKKDNRTEFEKMEAGEMFWNSDEKIGELREPEVSHALRCGASCLLPCVLESRTAVSRLISQQAYEFRGIGFDGARQAPEEIGAGAVRTHVPVGGRAYSAQILLEPFADHMSRDSDDKVGGQNIVCPGSRQDEIRCPDESLLPH